MFLSPTYKKVFIVHQANAHDLFDVVWQTDQYHKQSAEGSRKSAQLGHMLFIKY